MNLTNKNYKLETVDRTCEGASWEDIENGDGIETAYLVKDAETDEIILDTTNRNLAYSYLEEYTETEQND